MRKMHELKIPDTIMKAIYHGGHDMDLQLYMGPEEWAFNESWGKKKISDFSNSDIVIVEYVSAEYGTRSYALGYVSIDERIVSIMLLGSMSIIDGNDNYYSIVRIAVKTTHDDIGPYIAEGVVVNGFEDDSINIFKL